jgi:peptidoglycan/LPS O-acetylase OafA/YrhL
MGTDLRVDGLLLGYVFGLLTFYGYLPDFSKHKLLVSLTTVIAVLFGVWFLIEKQLTASAVPNFGIFSVSLLTIVMITRLVNYPSRLISKVFSFPPLVKIGVISYGLYLWHAPIGVMIDQTDFGLSGVWLAGIKILLTFIAAIISFCVIEKPILKLKNRFQSSQSRDCRLSLKQSSKAQPYR